MSWIRRHPFATAVFAVILVLFVLVAIFGVTEDEERSDVILGLILIYLFIVALYALAAWMYGKTFGRSKSNASIPSEMAAPPWTSYETPTHRPPVLPQQLSPRREWSAPTCERCGATNPAGAAFCDQCGARLAAAPPMPPPTGALQCPRCQTLLSPQVRFCTNCGLPRQAN